MKKAIFLDRDGIINNERGEYTYRIEDFTFVHGIIENLNKLQSAGFLLIIITNQGGLAKKVFSLKEFEKLNNYMNSKLKKHNVELAEIYYCPHHSDLEKCICRKPDSLMIEKAIARFNIEPNKSHFIGDKQSDIDAGEKIGVNGILVKANSNIKNIVDQIIKSSDV